MGEVLAGRFELLELIGGGASGDVWAAYDHRSRDVIAAKVMRQSDAGSLLRFVREQAVRLNDPRVIAPSGWAADDDRVVIAMPLAAGGSVASLIGDFGALPIRWTLRLGLDAARGLAAVHSAGLVHRDIKPENLLLAATGRARPRLFVADFGSAIALRGPRLTESGLVSGTPGYLAPEVLRGAANAPAQDLYALGGVLLRMITGQHPDVEPVPPPGGLATLIAELTGPAAGRPSSAATAERLAGLGATRPWVVGADEVEVLQHVDIAGLTPTARPGADDRIDRDVTVPFAPIEPVVAAPPEPAVPSKPVDSRSMWPVWALAIGGAALVVLAVLLVIL